MLAASRYSIAPFLGFLVAAKSKKGITFWNTSPHFWAMWVFDIAAASSLCSSNMQLSCEVWAEVEVQVWKRWWITVIIGLFPI